MKILRSWPEQVPPGRNYVVDTMPRFVMTGYDYRGLGDLNDDVLLVEWDMALSKEDFDTFYAHTRRSPGEVLVAPYRLYTPTARATPLPKGPIWVHRRYTDDEHATYHVDELEPTCHLWGLGVSYLPRQVIRDFLDDWPGHFSDSSLSGWHYRNVAAEVRITWDVRPIHLHYLIDTNPRRKP